MLLVLAITVGLGSGIGVWIFRKGIDFFHDLFTVRLAGQFLSPIVGAIAPVLALALAGLVVGLIMEYLVGHEKYHGVAGVIEAVALAGGRMRYVIAPFKAFASALSVGAGASIGPEDPSVQIGANLGSFLGQRLRLSEERVRLLVSAGAASAIAAAFNAPIAGVFFAMEVILGEFTTGSFGVVVLAAVISSAFTQTVAHVGPELGQLQYVMGSPAQLIFYVLLGVILAPVATLFIKVVYAQQDLWSKTIKLPRPLETALVGALVGFVGIFLPQILGTGSNVMEEVLNGRGEFGLTLLLLLGGAKLFVTALSIAGGFIGGVFAPSLYVGIMLGGAYGQVINHFASQTVSGDPHAYAIAGMAGVMAAVVRAPITAILLVFELTNNYELILPIMLTTVVCVYLVERTGLPGIYHLGLIRHGVYIRQGRDVDVMQGVTVGEAMQSPAASIVEIASLVDLRDALRRYHSRSLCVLDPEGRLSGIVTLTDLQGIYEKAESDHSIDLNTLTVGDICTREVVTANADDVLWTAIRNMGARDIGRVPVINPETREVVGMLRRHDIMYAYNMAIARKLQDQHRAEQIRLNTLTGAHVMELHIRPGAPIMGRHIADVKWPAESVIASIQRKNKLIVPHGSTDLRMHDVLTIVADPETEEELRALCGYQ